MKKKDTAVEKISMESAIWAANLYIYSGQKQPSSPEMLHYAALRIGGLSMPDGKAYSNSVSSLLFLEGALDSAQLLGLIPYDAFTYSCRIVRSDVSIAASASSMRPWKNILMGKIEKACNSYVRSVMAMTMPVHIEIWMENTTSADIVKPIAARYRVNMLSSTSAIPVRSLWDFVRRVSSITKPIRIFYLSDLTFVSDNSIGAETRTRAILKQYGLAGKIDLKFRKIALTDNQRRRFKLPLFPETDGEKDRGICQLYALEAVASGTIEQTLERYLKRYLDKGLMGQMARQTEAVMNHLLTRIGRIVEKNTEFKELISKFEAGLARRFSV